ncbi:MAG TPA: hypothetical protein V6C97_26535 [Oculatellaceae cyanobacterium]|jgi:hypothetical protein|nr:hypothetical protein [Cyanobacteria bacterium SZAS LIN-5]
MIAGILIINLDPPYMGFAPCEQAVPGESWCHCNHEQIRNLLLDLNIITINDPWPVRECFLRMPITLPKSTLLKHGLLLKLPKDVVVALPVRRLSESSAAMSS